MIRPDLSLPIPERIEAAHFIGIGGSGMSGLARMFLERGIRVSGSDRADSAALQELATLGARVYVGHDAANLGDADTVIHTGAIWPENPEFVTAKERGMPVIHRSQALYWLIGGRRLVSVAGAHGKTTSTGMIVTALRKLDADPTFVNGGVIAQLGASSATGSDDLFVIEADESDGTFLLYDTSIALITNVDPDHLDHYGTEDAFTDAFATFANRAREAVVLSADDPGARSVARAPDTSARCSPSANRMPPTYASPASAPTARSRSRSAPAVPPSTRAWAFPARTTRSMPPAPSPCCSRSATTSSPPSAPSRDSKARPPLRAARRRARRERLRRLCAPPDRGRGSPRRRPHGGRRWPDHRDPPAAHVLAHAADVPASSPRCSKSTPTILSCSTSTVRARIRSPV